MRVLSLHFQSLDDQKGNLGGDQHSKKDQRIIPQECGPPSPKGPAQRVKAEQTKARTRLGEGEHGRDTTDPLDLGSA